MYAFLGIFFIQIIVNKNKMKKRSLKKSLFVM